MIVSLLAVVLMVPTIVWGASALDVVLTSGNELVYENGSADLSTSFNDMYAGETRTAEITVTNNNSHTAEFFISQDTLQTLEESANASGAPYIYMLSVGSSEDTATVLFSTAVGGYSSAQVASTAGLDDVTEIEDYTYFAKLANGESTNLYLTLYIDGEGTDTDYADAVGTLEFNFRAYYDDARRTVVNSKTATSKGATQYIKNIVDQIVPLAGAVKTGDNTPIIAVIGLLAAGIVLIVISCRRKKNAC
jgi:LPXTG-motif cell wall-anchored protein